MNTIPAQDIKRRGMSAVDALLAKGPVHVIRNNRPRYVILSEDDYSQLLRATAPPTVAPVVAATATTDIWDFLRNRPWQGTRTREEIDAHLAEERASWDDDEHQRLPHARR